LVYISKALVTRKILEQLLEFGRAIAPLPPLATRLRVIKIKLSWILSH